MSVFYYALNIGEKGERHTKLLSLKKQLYYLLKAYVLCASHTIPLFLTILYSDIILLFAH